MPDTEDKKFVPIRNAVWNSMCRYLASPEHPTSQAGARPMPTPALLPNHDRRLTRLSPQQQLVFQYILRSPTLSAAAKALDMNSKTFGNQALRVYEKLGVANHHELLELAIKEGWVELPPPEVYYGLARSTLTARDHEVIGLTVAGKSAKQIGNILHLSPKTVDTYRSRLLSKLGMSNTRELILAQKAVDRELALAAAATSLPAGEAAPPAAGSAEQPNFSKRFPKGKNGVEPNR